jgi:glycosyltransferase involved in cell wall biosynthesis
MASTLASYLGAASRRDEKIIRAINSVINQTFQDWELIVVADGCQKTVDIVSQYTDPRISVVKIDKRPLWDGAPRNKGIELAKGEFITYLDNDDCLGENHLQIINDNLKDYDWVYYDDWTLQGSDWLPRHCDIRKIGMNGTSNITHKKSLDMTWAHRGYAHDHYFNEKLRLHLNYGKIPAGEYFVCHMPNGGIDV